MVQDEVDGGHHRLSGHGFEQALGDGERQGGLVCCSPWGREESDTLRLNNNKNISKHQIISRILTAEKLPQ